MFEEPDLFLYYSIIGLCELNNERTEKKLKSLRNFFLDLKNLFCNIHSCINSESWLIVCKFYADCNISKYIKNYLLLNLQSYTR